MSRFPELDRLFQSVDAYYKERGIFHATFGFGRRPAIVVVDFAYGWTDATYAGGSRNLDAPVQHTAELLATAREATGRRSPVPIIYTTSPWHPKTGDQPFKSAADLSPGFRPWDERACQLDERIRPRPEDLVIQKENASAFFGTHLIAYLVQHSVDTLLITGCSTSACIRATATDAKSYRLRPIIIRECVGDRSEVLHEFTLFDIRSRFADVVGLDETKTYLQHVEC
jgi:nicotinamidase-related amidase